MRTLLALQNPNAITQIFSEQSLARLKAIEGLDWLPPGDKLSEEAFAERLSDYECCITSWRSPKLSAPVLARATRLRFYGHAAGSLRPYLDPSAFDRDICVINSNKPLAMSAAELCFAIMIGGAWNIAGYTDRMRRGLWSEKIDGTLVMGLYGQTIGLIGMGEIARQLIRMLAPFAPRILVSSPHCSAQEAAQLGVELVDMDNLIRQSQIISLHDTLTERTERFITRKHIEQIRDGALFVNAARAGLVDTEALIEHLQSGRFFAAMDNYDQEPLPLGHPLANLPNVLSTPHIGGLSSYWRKQVGENIVNGLEQFLRGEEPDNRITRERFLQMTSQKDKPFA